MSEHERHYEEFKELCKPVVNFLNEHFHPHVKVLITPTSAELMEGLVSTSITEFIIED